MFQVRNKEVLRLLADRQMKKSRQRNGIAIGAIVLTTILFSALFTIGGGVLEQMQQAMMRMHGGVGHAYVKFLSMPEYETLKAAGGYEDIGYSIITGSGADESLQKLNTEVRYGEAYAARDFRAFPTEGRMPEEKMEIAASRLVLEAMGLSDALGSRIPFSIRVNGTVYEDTFTLCGVWDGDPIAPAQEIWVSKAYCEETAPTLMTAFGEGVPYEGTVMAAIDFSNTWNIQGKLDDLLARAKMPGDTRGGVNPVYAQPAAEPGLILTAVILLGAILISGYLIIYNVFYISVTQDIQFYGLLKTIGASGKQLRRIVLRQAMKLSAIGIPAGLLAGYAVGKGLLPFVVGQFSIDGFGEYSVSPLVLPGAALFSLLTVFISFRSPGRTAARVSPVEAVRYTGEHRIKCSRRKPGIIRKMRKSAFRQQNNWSVSKKDVPRTLALRSLRRDGKKSVLVILSLFLSLTLLNTTCTILRGFDLERYVETQTNADFEVTDWTVAAAGVYEKKLEGIDPEFEEAVRRIPGLTRLEKVYCEEGMMDLSEDALEWIAQQEAQGRELPGMGSENGQEFMQAYAATGSILEHGEYDVGTFDAEKWAGGGYVIYNDSMVGYGLRSEPMYRPGDSITLEGSDGQKKEYTVMAQGELPYTMTARKTINLGITVILPEQEFAWLYGEKQPLCVVYDVEKSHWEEAEKITAGLLEDSNKVCISFETLKAEFQQTKRACSLIGGILSLILGAIGILNFINLAVTGILTRQKELAMLGAIGMGGRQMKRMLIWESTAYIGSAALLSVTAGNLLGWQICRDPMIRNQWAFTYHFTLAPVAACLPILLLAASAVPLVFYKKLCKKSIVERLRCC